MFKKTLLLMVMLALAVLTTACGTGAPPDSQTALAPGEPSYPAFQGSWVIDTTNTVPKATIDQANAVLQKLRDEGIAETVIVVIKGVKDPVTWSTRYGRYIKLGSVKTENGLVYLVQPDKPVGGKVQYSVAKGLTRFTSGRVTEAIESKVALEEINKGDLAAGIVALAQGTDGVLRSLYKPNPEAVTKDGQKEKPKMSPEDQQKLFITVVVIVAVWFLIGLALCLVDPELGLQWWLFGLRILLLAASGGKAGGTGGGGGFGGRSGSR